MEKENILFELIKNIQEDKLIKIVFSDRIVAKMFQNYTPAMILKNIME